MATLYILYGSATGNAEGIALDLAEKSPPSPFTSIECKPMDNFKKLSDGWSQAPTGPHTKHGIIFITSTTGNGDPPENANRFVRYMKRKQTIESQPFQHCAFAVLGLGDTNYDQFCATGKAVDKKMQELGGTRAKDLACADEATGLEDVVEPWLETILQDMSKACSETGTGAQPDTDTDTDTAQETSTVIEETSTVIEEPQPSPPVTALAAPPAKSEFPLCILYGSATGNAEQIAKDLSASYESLLQNPDAQTFFPSVICCELDLFKKKCQSYWEQQPPGNTKHGLIIVASTTGNGDAPENSCRFMRYIKRKQTLETQPFQNVNYSVLGLGDTNYDQFCNTGKNIDKRMMELGGNRIKPLACADEATGLEDVVEPWTCSILSDITNSCRGAGTSVSPSISTNVHPETERGNEEEEKKAESNFETVPLSTTNSSSLSIGVKTIRSLLSLSPDAPIPTVDNASLPSLGGSRSTSEFVQDDEPFSHLQSPRKPSFDHSEADFLKIHYTFDLPFESNILSARYLTKATSTDGAARVCETFGPDGIFKTDHDTIVARDILDSHFPLDGQNINDVERNEKRVLEMTLALPNDKTLEYEPGDSIGLVATNTPKAVTFVLSMLQDLHGIQKASKVSIDSNQPVTVEQAVREHFDLCSTIKSKRILNSLAQFATDPEESAALRLMSSKGRIGDKLFMDYVVNQRRTVVDILKEFSSCQNVSLEGLLSILPGIPPRYYSVSSSPLVKQREAPSLTVAFSVVDYLTPSLVVDGKEQGRRRIHGVATGWLETICSPFLSDGVLANAANKPPPTVKIFPKPTTDFRLPANLSTPMVLIGPGTGIAPFMGFLAHRKALVSSLMVGADSSKQQREVGEVDVYFGCRHADHDWLYESEMKDFKQERIITNLHTAFSRDNDDPKKRTYVQDMMKSHPECAKRVVDVILNMSGSVYICGDGNRMARGVQLVIAELLGKSLGGDESSYIEKGFACIEEMKSKGRLLLDIWT